jgi:hypothetical protein
MSLGLALAVPAVSPTTAGATMVADSSAAAVARLSSECFFMMVLLDLVSQSVVPVRLTCTDAAPVRETQASAESVVNLRTDSMSVNIDMCRIN